MVGGGVCGKVADPDPIGSVLFLEKPDPHQIKKLDPDLH
jgi:hypothetical protein